MDPNGYVYMQKYGENRKVEYLKFSPDGYFVCEYIKKEDLDDNTFFQYKAFSDQFMFVTNGYAIYQYRILYDPKEPLEFVKVFLNEIEYEPDKTCKLSHDGLICAQDKLFTYDYYHNRITIYNFYQQRIGFIQSPILEFGSCYGSVEIPKNIFSNPEGITVGPDENLYVVDHLYNKMSILNQNGDEINSLALPFDQTKKCIGSILLPYDIIFDPLGYCYVSDIKEASIHIFKPDLSPHMVFDVSNCYPVGLAINSSGQLALCASNDDPWESIIFLYDISRIESKEITLQKTIEIKDYLISFDGDIVVDEHDNMILNAKWSIQDNHLIDDSNKILWISPNGEIIKEIEFDHHPKALYRDESGNLYTILQEVNTIIKLNPEGQTLWEKNIEQCGLACMTSDNSGHLLITNSYHNVVLVISDITLDKTPPILKISPIPQVVYDPILLIQGETEPEATVTVNQQNVLVKPDNSFEAEINLHPGENTLLVIATDKAGNLSEFTQQVVLKERTIIQLFIGQSLIIVNGKTSTLDSAPYIDKNSGRTMVPFRIIAESLGADILFD